VNNYENPIKWCTIDLLLRDCWVLKRLITKYYFKQPNNVSSTKFKTVKDFFGTVETSVYYDGYSGTDSDSDSENEDINDLDTFEQEYMKMIERSKKQGLISSEESADESKTKTHFLNNSLAVRKIFTNYCKLIFINLRTPSLSQIIN